MIRIFVIIVMGVLWPIGPGDLVMQTAQAAEDKPLIRASGLPLPRFVSLRSDKVFVRAGPALRYPIKWVYQKQGVPVEIIQEFDTWRKIRDRDGDEGWIHQSLLSGQRNILISSDEPVLIYRQQDPRSMPVAILEPGVMASVKNCEDSWCLVGVDGFKGWIERNLLWGIYDHEKLD